MSGYGDGKNNPFDDRKELTIEGLDQEIYGSADDLPVSSRVNVKRIAIEGIMADAQQPRRTVPSEVRRELPDYYRKPIEALHMWHQLAEVAHGDRIDIRANLMMQGDGNDDDLASNGIVDSFFALIALASSIQRDGLTNPITIVVHRSDEIKYVIDTGERRWLAHHLLVMYEIDNHEQIAARVVSRADVWRQATENNSRSELNAISKARQLALLLMDLHESPDGSRFDPIDSPLWIGRHEREFYAQVANGNRYSIQRGAGKRILDATGIASRNAITRYRNLLMIPDELWDEADDGDWAEGRIRGVTDEAKPAPVVGEREMDEYEEPHQASDEYGLKLLLEEISDMVGQYPVAQTLNWMDVSFGLRSLWETNIDDIIAYLNRRGYFVGHHEKSAHWLFLDTDHKMLSTRVGYVIYSPATDGQQAWGSENIDENGTDQVDNHLVVKGSAMDDDLMIDDESDAHEDSQVYEDLAPASNPMDARLKLKVLSEHPESLTTLLMVLRQMARDEENLLLANQLLWLLDMTREGLNSLVQNNPAGFWDEWANKADDGLADFLADLMGNFRADFEEYLTKLSAIAETCRD